MPIASALVASDCNKEVHPRRKQPPDGDGSRRFWLMGVVVDRQGTWGLTNDGSCPSEITDNRALPGVLVDFGCDLIWSSDPARGVSTCSNRTVCHTGLPRSPPARWHGAHPIRQHGSAWCRRLHPFRHDHVVVVGTMLPRRPPQMGSKPIWTLAANSPAKLMAIFAAGVPSHG